MWADFDFIIRGLHDTSGFTIPQSLKQHLIKIYRYNNILRFFSDQQSTNGEFLRVFHPSDRLHNSDDKWWQNKLKWDFYIWSLLCKLTVTEYQHNWLSYSRLTAIIKQSISKLASAAWDLTHSCKDTKARKTQLK